jgi:hypothetical protein
MMMMMMMMFYEQLVRMVQNGPGNGGGITSNDDGRLCKLKVLGKYGAVDVEIDDDNGGAS